ncbi:hypothetical protein BDZ85DRAFT_264868 [Elsinoe ampelina]|uniref:Uncharacterized protein n=1 Tax=Elsinoe ampelina TaxID=302913 RepID=A0A6A6G905_9PEZI|nr:hypothetical protein BDZ85DRAFT_264868 [Elsinoe ampelina]
MASLLYSGRDSDHYRISSLVPLKARVSTGAKLSIISSYESKEKLKNSLPRSQSTPYLPSTLKSVHHAGATKGAIPSPHSGLVTEKSLSIALAQAPPIIDSEFDLINEDEHHYRKLLGKVIDDSADEYHGTEDLYNRFRANEAERLWAEHVREREEKRERFEKERRERQYAMLKGNMGLHGQSAGKGKGKEKKRLTREEILKSDEESDGEDGLWF